jgi:hypothetical protein
MTCGVCGHLLDLEGDCPYCRRKTGPLAARVMKAILIALPLLAPAVYLGYSHLVDLARRTGMQWDSDMEGPWVRTDQKLCQIYRIHIVDRQDRALSQNNRAYKPGDRLVANFHARALKPGVYQPRLLITGQEPKLGKPITFQQGNFEEFHSGLISTAISDQAGPRVLRLELECGNEKAFWETDIQVQKP